MKQDEKQRSKKEKGIERQTRARKTEIEEIEEQETGDEERT